MLSRVYNFRDERGDRMPPLEFAWLGLIVWALYVDQFFADSPVYHLDECSGENDGCSKAWNCLAGFQWF